MKAPTGLCIAVLYRDKVFRKSNSKMARLLVWSPKCLGSEFQVVWDRRSQDIPPGDNPLGQTPLFGQDRTEPPRLCPMWFLSALSKKGVLSWGYIRGVMSTNRDWQHKDLTTDCATLTSIRVVLISLYHLRFITVRLCIWMLRVCQVE